jgi:bifunctional ADP-heptose synthase (sugar kinase/adenylyltransferase)
MALSDERVEHILRGIPALTIGVVGDLFLDRYLDIDAALTEPSLETGLDAYQVVRVRAYPGAAGTVINNLVALGVGRVIPVAVTGDDGEGYELRQALQDQRVVELCWLLADAGRRTPTYTKPMLREPGQPPRELNRLDIKNRHPLGPVAEQHALEALDKIWPEVDAVVVLDQVSEAECGVVTTRMRDRLAELGRSDRGKMILADSRERIGLFRYVALKPNQRECCKAADTADVGHAVRELAGRTQRAVFCTAGDKGIILFDPERGDPLTVAAYPVRGPIDPVGAGDSTSAGIVCARAAGATLAEAAAFGNLVASITVQQIGVTGTASPDQVRRQWAIANS